MSDQTETPRTFKNCGAMCAEMLGGLCTGDDCPYKPSLCVVTGDEPWAEFAALGDIAQLEIVAELRGFRNGYRDAYAQYRQGIRFGFWCGVGTFFVALFLLAIIQWAAR